MRTAAILLLTVCALIISGCHGPQLTPPAERFPTAKRMEAPFAEVWEATLDTIFEQAPLSVVSREERLIATDWQYGKSDYAYEQTAPFGLGSKEYLDSRWRMNVRLTDRGKSTVVSIKLIEEVRELHRGTDEDYSYSVWEPIESSTRRERDLLDEIASRVRSPGPSGQRARIDAKLDEMLEEKEFDKAIKYLEHELEFNITDEDLKAHFEKRLEEIRQEMQEKSP